MKELYESRHTLNEQLSQKPERALSARKPKHKKPFAIEHRFIKGWFLWSKTWRVWARYETKEQREKALVQLRKSHSKLYEFRLQGEKK